MTLTGKDISLAHLAIVLILALTACGVAWGITKKSTQANEDYIGENACDIKDLRDDIVAEIARIESQAREQWKDNEEEHDDMMNFQWETRSLINEFKSTAVAISSDITELKYETKEMQSQLKLNRAEMQAWERDRLGE